MTTDFLIWSASRRRRVTLGNFWRRYKRNSEPLMTVADLAADAGISPSVMAGWLLEAYGDEYRRLVEKRRGKHTRRQSLSDAEVRELFHRYRSGDRPTLRSLSKVADRSSAHLSQRFDQLFGREYKDMACTRRAHNV